MNFEAVTKRVAVEWRKTPSAEWQPYDWLMTRGEVNQWNVYCGWEKYRVKMDEVQLP